MYLKIYDDPMKELTNRLEKRLDYELGARKDFLPGRFDYHHQHATKMVEHQIYRNAKLVDGLADQLELAAERK